MGWLFSTIMPGITAIFSSIASPNSSYVLPDFHSLSGLRIIIKSVALGGIGSVGTSPAPVLPTTIFTSSNCLAILEASIEVSMLCVNEVSIGILNSIAYSPSCSWGINSPPIRLNKKILTANMAMVIPTNQYFMLIAFSSKG